MLHKARFATVCPFFSPCRCIYMKTKEDCFWPKISLETVAMQQHNTALIHNRNLNVWLLFPDYCHAFSALLHFIYQKRVHFIFSLILRGKGRGSVILFQLSGSCQPRLSSCFHIQSQEEVRQTPTPALTSGSTSLDFTEHPLMRCKASFLSLVLSPPFSFPLLPCTVGNPPVPTWIISHQLRHQADPQTPAEVSSVSQVASQEVIVKRSMIHSQSGPFQCEDNSREPQQVKSINPKSYLHFSL